MPPSPWILSAPLGFTLPYSRQPPSHSQNSTPPPECLVETLHGRNYIGVICTVQQSGAIHAD